MIPLFLLGSESFNLKKAAIRCKGGTKKVYR